MEVEVQVTYLVSLDTLRSGCSHYCSAGVTVSAPHGVGGLVTAGQSGFSVSMLLYFSQWGGRRAPHYCWVDVGVLTPHMVSTDTTEGDLVTGQQELKS